MTRHHLTRILDDAAGFFLTIALAAEVCSMLTGFLSTATMQQATTVTADAVFAAESAYQVTASTEAAMMSSLDPATKAKLKALDNAAYNDLQPLVVAASTPGATIDAVAFAGAQDALTAFSNATKGN